MKGLSVVFSLLLSESLGFAPPRIDSPASVRCHGTLFESLVTPEGSIRSSHRRNFLGGLATGTFGLIGCPGLSFAGLLDDYGTDPKTIAEKQPDKPVVAGKKVESTIEPNLRSNYYYPTNKKRYLPRIKKCNDAIPLVANSIGENDWEAVDDFVNKVADDTILPLKLYTSSLSGGGTNVKVSYTKDMMTSANTFEKNQKLMVKAVKKKDQKACSQALEGMSEALLSYRTAGGLLGADGGGNIPSVDEIRRSACRVQGRSFDKRREDKYGQI
eukprot:CAMPEP_0113306710 /NCGR_PEP_ID=MMETSP0010_2-20120614/5854_1 /TAXON_ID=216773 ORGANISM="Corethron hystrix, Strain 308" /NCGR_SAMPLE_ID=MMETSP0010_2 /ASSEMBLY_ACC=CAM_ASM_000155 /LENGTH=270 /DNA_ID=CAMNT_0000161435 /DNA_START=159 /DNA_END=971 /DNA_ORIENTATION=- /assembly_acc=CAM_ASM_000155